MKRKRIIVTVINDLATDQRVKRMCDTLHQMGFDILLVGRKRKGSLAIDDRPYSVHRMKLLFHKGPLFYICFTIRLFFLLLFSKHDILHSNDLDTLLPCYLVSKIKKKKLVYDSHELFTEVPELIHRPRIQRIWLRIEKWIFPRLKHVITVNNSIANIYQNKYNVSVTVIRNLPQTQHNIQFASRKEFGLPESEKIILLQGAGINIDRGAEEAVEAMKFVHNAILVIAGSGDVIPQLKEYVDANQMKDKVKFIPKMTGLRLKQLTALADCGISFDKDTNLNYRFSLPNKLFDYINAGIPVLVSNLPEIANIVTNYQVGLLLESHDIQEIASKMNKICFEIPSSHWTNALQQASKELNWENEQTKLISIYEPFLR